MQTVCYTTTVRIRRPESKVVDLNEYRRRMEAQDAPPEAPALQQKPLRRRSLRRRLTLASLLLEVTVSASILLLALIATVRFLLL